MDSLKKINLPLIILGAMNLSGGLIHWAFEFFLLSDTSAYRGFLLIENLLIGLVFIYFAWSIFFDDPLQKRVTLRLNIIFWLIFSIAFLIFQPEVTSLEMIKHVLPWPQRLILFCVGVTAFGLSFVGHGDIKNKTL